MSLSHSAIALLLWQPVVAPGSPSLANVTVPIQGIFETIQHFIEGPEVEPKRRIGFPISEAGPTVAE